MANDPQKHRRNSLRLYGHDYTYPGYYFVTICTHNRMCLLGHVENAKVVLSNWGHIAYNNWYEIPDHFSSVKIDCFVIMPNHAHGIVVIEDSEDTNTKVESPTNYNTINGKPDVGAEHAAPLTGLAAPGSLGVIVRSYKSSVTRQVNKNRNTPGAQFWQRNYYEHIIRNEKELAHIREYISMNPAKWSEDRYFTM